MSSPRFCSRALLFASIFSLCVMTTNGLAQSTNRQIGTQYEVTADPLVVRPHTQPCVVPLFANYQFATFAESVQNFQFAPPSNCKGPWQKVVFEADFSENAGIQFDRTASIYIANTNVYFGTTPEPLSTVTNTWHVERDITDYTALLTAPQQGTIVLQNCTSTDCPAGYSYLNGVFTVNADLEFYPADEHGWGQSGQSAPPDAVLPLTQSNGSGGVNLPVILSSPTDQYSTTFTLPTNIEKIYMDVVSQSQSGDEQWYACLPNDMASINEVYGCGNTDFRETEVTIDGKAAGLAPVSPWVFTGFLPDIWVPQPGAQTLEFVPYRVNLTPFAGALNDGNPHTVAISIFDDGGYFSETASLLLYLDHGSKQVTGAVTANTLGAPSPVVTENLSGTSIVTGTVGVKQDRSFTIAGYVHTSHGKVSTSISEQQSFASTQTIDFDTTSAASVEDQKTVVANKVATSTTVTDGHGTTTTLDNWSFPITVDFIYPVSTAEFGFTVAFTQNYQADEGVALGWFPIYFSSTSNNVQATDVSPAASAQQYSHIDSTGDVYNCQIKSKNNTLSNVSKGCSQNQQ